MSFVCGGRVGKKEEVSMMPTTESGRNKILKWLDENDTSVATLAAMYGLNVQDARDYLSGRKDAPAGARFILKVMRDLKIK